jgi:acyl-CoA reductase-like NAD-dependent aldehyde dehydrogenase
MKDIKMRINGASVGALDGRTLPVQDPATGETIAIIPRGSVDDVHMAADAAELAAPGWGSTPMRTRGKILFTGAQAVRRNLEDLARQLTIEQGKPLREATDEIRGFCNVIEYYAACSGLSFGEYIEPATGGEAIVRQEPVGTCGAIIPWNMPAIIMAWKTAPALLAGNPVILKPSSTAPLTVIALSEIMEQAGIPGGILNVVTGTGEEAGAALARERSLRVLSFTGSTATGKTVRELASRNGTTVVCELGGSDPMIVMPDADLDAAVKGAVNGRFYNAGQVCTAVKRLYVHTKIAGDFISRLDKAVADCTFGNGLESGVRMGPLNNRAGQEHIGKLVDDALEKCEGKVLSRGRPGQGLSRNGYFYPPTLINDVPIESRLFTDEVFGPVLPVSTVPDLETAIRYANSSIYGLGASVWTHDTRVIREFFSKVHAGVVWVNRHVSIPPEIPFGGIGESGTGRENGREALLHYMKSKTLYYGP